VGYDRILGAAQPFKQQQTAPIGWLCHAFYAGAAGGLGARQVGRATRQHTTRPSAFPLYLLFPDLISTPQQGSIPDRSTAGLLYEWDGLTPAQVHDEFCTPTADDTVLTIGSLTMRFSVEYGPLGSGLSYNPFGYDWIFISSHGSVYWFDFAIDDLPVADGSAGYSAHVARAIIKTFAPQYATWGCA
jgi:hypothetical protein